MKFYFKFQARGFQFGDLLRICKLASNTKFQLNNVSKSVPVGPKTYSDIGYEYHYNIYLYF